jgi:hypothetical protein
MTADILSELLDPRIAKEEALNE